jgi:hypothetical protein
MIGGTALVEMHKGARVLSECCLDEHVCIAGALGAAVQNFWTYEAKPEYQFFDVSISMVDGSLQNDTVIPVARPLWVSAAGTALAQT